MPLQSQLPRVLRFGIYEIDVRAGELRRSGVKLKLQEQPLQVLCVLLEHPGEVVTREDLRSQLWPADTFVDFDHGLNAAIKRLRDALGESAENPRFVETVARRGYRFIGIPEIPAATPSARPAPWQWLSTTRNAVVVGLIVCALALSFSILPPFDQTQSSSDDCNPCRHQRWRKIYTNSFARWPAFGLRLEWWSWPSLQLVCESRRH